VEYWSNGKMKKMEYWSIGVMEYWKNPRNPAKGLSDCFTTTPVLQYSITPALRYSITPILFFKMPGVAIRKG
jgi:hypothetical protein